MEDLHSLLTQRRSIRKYTEEPLTADQVTAILEAALMSPSSKRSCSWQFVVVEQKEMLQQLSHCKDAGAKPIAGASLAIVVLGDQMKSDVWIEDASIASILIQLQVEELGLGSCWIQVRERLTANGQSSEDYVRDALQIPPQMRVLSIIAIGNKDEEKAPFDSAKLKWEHVHIDSFRNDDTIEL